MSTNKQQAVILGSKHGKIAVDTREIPTPGPGELLVKVKAAALNPVDWKIQKYDIFVDSYPAVLGTDIAGDVEQVGEGVSGFSKGDRVFFQGAYENNYAGFQQYTLAGAATTAKIPNNLTYEDVSTLPVAFTAAYLGLYNTKPHGLQLTSPVTASQRGQLAGKPLVVFGGSSSVGQFVIQLAKLSGFSPIIATSSLKHAEFLKSLGATHIIDRHVPASSLGNEIAKITDAPIGYVYDAISSAETQQVGHDLLVPGGQMVIVLPLAVAKADDKTVVHVVGLLRLPEVREALKGMYSHLTKLLEDGDIIPNRHQTLPGGLGAVVEGLQRLKNDQVSGLKLVVNP